MVVDNPDSDEIEEDDDDTLLTFRSHDIWMAILINIGAIVSTRMMSIDYVYKNRVLKSLKYIITKDFLKSLFKGFFSNYIGLAILLQSLKLSQKIKASTQVII